MGALIPRILLVNSNQWYFNNLVKKPCHKTHCRCPHRLNLSFQSSRSCALPVKFRRTQYPHHKNQHIPEKSGITCPMQSTHSNVNSISDLPTGNGNDATPFSQQSVVLTKQAYIELKWQAKYWRAQHEQLSSAKRP